MKTIEEVIRFHSTPPSNEFWSKASKRATRRIPFVRLPFNWADTMTAHFREFETIENTRTMLLNDFRFSRSRRDSTSEPFESFFERLGERLEALGEITRPEKELMNGALRPPSAHVPDLTSEYAKAAYLNACLEIGRLRRQSEIEELARRGIRWWDLLLPE